MSDFIEGLDGDLFTQFSLRDPFEHEECVEMGAIPDQQGDFTNVFCPDPERKGRVVIDGKIQGDPPTNATTIRIPVSHSGNRLITALCEFQMFIAWACDGMRSIVDNFESGVVLLGGRRTDSPIDAPVVQSRGNDTRLEGTVNVAYDSRYFIYYLMVNAVSMTNTADANSIAMLPDQCESKCANARDLCTEGYMGLDGTLYDSEVKKTHDGTTWSQTPADPFDEGGDAGDIVLFIRYNGHRALIARMSQSEWAPAEVAYTEDWGVSWTNVDVGNVAAQFIGGMHMKGGWTYAACSGGDVYRSKDMGDTWARVAHDVTTENLHDICMQSKEVGYAVGNNNAFIYTANGDNWYARTGPAAGVNLLSVAVNRAGDVFVGAADGNLYRSEDGGVTWIDTDGNAGGIWRAFGTGSIDRIKFDRDEQYFGGLVFNTAAPVGTFYRSFDGGRTWREEGNGVTGNWNAGLNDFNICDQNHFYLVGNAYDGNTGVWKVEPAA